MVCRSNQLRHCECISMFLEKVLGPSEVGSEAEVRWKIAGTGRKRQHSKEVFLAALCEIRFVFVSASADPHKTATLR